MPPERRFPEQLNVPLVWDVGLAPAPDARDDDPFPPLPRPAPAGSGRLVVAAVADGGMLGLGVACGWALAVVGGAGLSPAQLVTAALLGVEVASVAAVTSLFGWRGTPGMLLVGVLFQKAIPLPRAAGTWLAWLASLPLLGLPLVVGNAGRRVLERLGGSPVSRRFPGAAA